MRSNVLMLAVGLFVADSALAGPCKPRTSIADPGTTTSIDSTSQSAMTAGKTSTVVSSEALTEGITTTTIAPDTTAATTLDAQITTTADITIIASETETTATEEAATTVSEAETTTTAPAPAATPTFTIVGGGGSINGAPLKGTDQAGSIMLFNPETGNTRARTFVLDPDTGRMRDRDTGIAVCAYYGDSNSPSVPHIGYCQTGNTGPDMYYDYLTCEVASGNLLCTAPKASCSEDENGFTTCSTETTTSMNNQFYYKHQNSAGDYLYISSGQPVGYTSVDIIAQES